MTKVSLSSGVCSGKNIKTFQSVSFCLKFEPATVMMVTL